MILLSILYSFITKQRTLQSTLFFLLFTSLTHGTEIIPLSDIKVGMIGEWKTVVEGNQLRKFRLEVLGIQPNFAGPRQPVIICKALDEEHIKSGPVAGMSGSPVYFDGKLAGAYAYGYLWPKEQAIIGVTPIEKMLEVLEIEEPAKQSPSQLFSENSFSDPVDLENKLSPLQALPTTIAFSGLSQKTLQVFEKEFSTHGWATQLSGTDSNPYHSTVTHKLEPGYPVAGVLMQGDFGAAGVGTITWREGNRILGFGHPFNGDGHVAIPMAGAEIITIIQAARSSFKLSKTGPIIGTITEDRLTAIEGMIGEKTKMIPLSIAFEDTVYRAEMINHPEYTPLMSAIALMEVLGATLSKSKEATFLVNFDVTIDEFDPINFEVIASGFNQGPSVAINFLLELQALWNNSFLRPQNAEIAISITKKNEIELSRLKSIRLDRSIFRTGDKATISLLLETYQDDNRTIEHEFIIPQSINRKDIQLTICDSKTAAGLLGRSFRQIDQYEDLLARLEAKKPANLIHIFLREPSEGLIIEGQSLENLPPSMITLLSPPTIKRRKETLKSTILSHQTIAIDEVFSGNSTQTLNIHYE